MTSNNVPQRSLPFWMRPGFNPFEGCHGLPPAVFCLARQNHFRWVLYPGIGWQRRPVR